MKKKKYNFSTKDTLLEVHNISMRFSRYANGILSLKELFIGLLSGKLKRDKICSLQDINFTIRRGESVAILGHNGAGKSTLLKIVSGILQPTKGYVNCHASISPLLNLGAGFDPNATGLENLFINGAILGMTRKELLAKKDAIIEFSELGDFIHDPVKNYSSGMVARLGFSIAVHYDADIVIVDEVLNVGDIAFNSKCNAKMQELRKKGKTFLVVSHSETVKHLCSRSIWLNHGKLIADGNTEEVFKLYTQYMQEHPEKDKQSVGGEISPAYLQNKKPQKDYIESFLATVQEEKDTTSLSGVSFEAEEMLDKRK